MSVGSLAYHRLPRLAPRVVGSARWPGGVAATTVCAYVAVVALPLRPDLGSAVLGAGALLIAVTGARDHGRRGSRKLDAAIAAFLCASGLSIVTSLDPARSFRLSVAFLPALLLFVVIARQLATPEGTRLIAQVLSTVALVVGGMVAQAAWTGAAASPAGLVTATRSPLLVVPNDAVLLALIVPLSLGLVLGRGGVCGRALGLLSLVAIAMVLVVLQSRIGVLTMLGGMSIVVVLARSRRGVAALMGLAVLTLVVDAAQGFVLAAKFGQVLDPRVALWMTGLAMWVDAPFLGHGPRTFGLVYAQYRDALSLPAWLPVDDRIVPWAHSLWVEALAEQGVVGLLALVALVACGLRGAWGLLRRTHGDARSMAAGVFAALVAFCGAATVELTFLRQWVVVVLFTLLGLSAGRKESS